MSDLRELSGSFPDRNSGAVSTTLLPRLYKGTHTEDLVLFGVDPGVNVFLGNVATSFVGGDFLSETKKVDGVAALLVASVAVYNQSGQSLASEDHQSEPTKPEIEAARLDPDSIIDMIRTAPPTAFHEAVMNADVSGLLKRFDRYANEGLAGFWRSMYMLGQDEIRARRGASGLKSEHRQKVGSLERRATIFRNSKLSEPPLDDFSNDYIVELDNRVINGTDNPFGAELTQERLERWAAVQLDFILKRDSAGLSPGQVGQQYVKDLLDDEGNDGATDEMPMASASLLLTGINRMLCNARAVYHHDKHFDVTTPMPDELMQLEALSAAVQAKSELESHMQLEEKVFLDLVATLQGVEVLQTEAELSEHTQAAKLDSFMRFDNVTYTQEDFVRDVSIASTVRKLIQRYRGARGIVEFETKLKARLERLISVPDHAHEVGSSVLDAVFAPDLQARMTEADFADVRAAAQSRQVVDADPVVTKLAAEAQIAQVARENDPSGRYAEVRSRAAIGDSSERHQRDFRGKGRVLNYYGSLSGKYRENDGSPGGMEAVVLATGTFAHIDTAGLSPMRDSLLRGRLEKHAEQLGHSVQVHEPFEVVPPDYLCEMANFFGLLPDGLTVEDIIKPVIPNGIATVSYESNRNSGSIGELLKSDQRKFDTFDMRVLPTELIRFLKTDGISDYEIGHADPRWKWGEHTVVLFMHKSNGAENDLLAFLNQHATAKSSSLLLAGQIQGYDH